MDTSNSMDKKRKKIHRHLFLRMKKKATSISMDQKITERVLMRGTSLLRRIRIPLYSRTARFKRGDEVALMELTFL